MTIDQAKRLKKDDVIYHSKYELEGTVLESPNPNYCINIEWADGIVSSLHPDTLLDAERFNKVVKK